jgi:hypothetical protein
MIYTAHDSGANLSKLDAISVFLNFLHREYRYHQLLLRGENIYFIHLTHTEREREREREREPEREIERPCESIAAGSTNDNVADGVVSGKINKCTWNVNVMEDHLLCFNLKCSVVHENILIRPISQFETF